MGIGGSIFLIAVGAIFTFAVHLSVGWLDLRVLGWVLMAAGALGLILTMLLWQRRRTSVTVTQPAEQVEERRYVEDSAGPGSGR